MNRQIIIFDTTLRDGEQALSITLNTKKKLRIALALEKLGVDVIELGFPISSPEEFRSVQTIAKQIKNCWVCAIARCIDKDIDVAAEALQVAKNFRIHVFLATSTLHIKSKLKKNFSQIMEMAIHSVKYARKYTDDVEFSCEDAGRTSIDNLCRIVEATINAGARTINIPDTVGYTTPHQFSEIITSLYERVPSIDKAIISVHCHDDLGMAVGNSIAAIQAGARQVEGTLNGIGERAGNTALEEVIMAIKIRQDLLGVYTNIRHKEIYHTSKVVSQLCNVPISPNKAIVGSNAFSHSSGIHQDGILKNRQNYEIIVPESIGRPEVKLHLTSRSGRAALKHYMQLMGYLDDDYDLDILYKMFLKLADKKGQVFDYDLELLIFVSTYGEIPKYFCLKKFNVQYSSIGIITAALELICGNAICADAAVGVTSIHAIYKVLTRITNINTILNKYEFFIKYHDSKIFVKTNIIMEFEGRHFYGTSSAEEVIESCVKAMINIFNDIWRACQIKVKLCKLHKM
ncbi:2-isopropylmalate synthase [Blochmannia endosymbiont of Camponotus (Colobopsis) obliquus]|uniref:2-isopropylmalate synthase n=1 Tax=Blochmannia endosymbiont of Camponotus (Colobopsis) obliquus TaxID=1505597 RepID=UPI00061A5C06|nr:2-isopropylmalate synthase [Blochmannia endosymbiont of Camponotus (Colobopsis) obliquus]AKC60305.1 2-isopropylmalate synthase [Blochmannia endosymbiont of Camponotus (Colobopsis) obliquus]